MARFGGILEAAAELIALDPIELGMLAHAERCRRLPERVVTYSFDPEGVGIRLAVDPENPAFSSVKGSEAVLPVCPPGATGVEYLRAVALCRLQSGAIHVQVDAEWCGLKVAQLALRFGADDLCCGGSVSEEELRRVIRETGLMPKKRSADFGWVSVF